MNYIHIMPPVPFASKSGGSCPPAPMGTPPMSQWLLFPRPRKKQPGSSSALKVPNPALLDSRSVEIPGLTSVRNCNCKCRPNCLLGNSQQSPRVESFECANVLNSEAQLLRFPGRQISWVSE